MSVDAIMWTIVSVIAIGVVIVFVSVGRPALSEDEQVERERQYEIEVIDGHEYILYFMDPVRSSDEPVGIVHSQSCMCLEPNQISGE